MSRAAWLATLTPDDRVILHTVAGQYPAVVTKISLWRGEQRLWLRACKPSSSLPLWDAWVWRETGDCPGARIWIEPAPEPIDSLEVA